jgi:hypothetical protein
MSKHGHNFEREAILEWLSTHNQICPLTRKPLTPSMLFPNAKLRLKIRSWQQENDLEVSCPGLDCRASVYAREKLVFSAQDMAKHFNERASDRSRERSGSVNRRRRRNIPSVQNQRVLRMFA